MARVTDLTLIAHKISDQRSALLAYGDDMTIEQAREINETSGFTIERAGGLGSTLVVQGIHLTNDELKRVYQQSESLIG